MSKAPANRSHQALVRGAEPTTRQPQLSSVSPVGGPVRSHTWLVMVSVCVPVATSYNFV